MRITNYLKVIIFVAPFILFGCKKEQGCTNPLSTTYNVNAEEDDGSCLYEGSAVFYHEESTSQTLAGNGITTLNYYIEGAFVGSAPANVFYSTTPTCQSSSAVNFLRSLGGLTSKSFNYSIKDQNSITVTSGFVMLDADACNQILITL